MFDNFLKKDETGKIISSGQKWWLPIILTTIFVLVLLILGTGLMGFEIYYQDKFFPGTKVGNINLAGLNKNQTFTLLENKLTQLDKDNLKIQYPNNNELKTIIINNSTDPNLGFNYFDFDIYRSVYDNFNIGRDRGLVVNIFNQALIFIGTKQITINHKINRDYVIKSIKEELGVVEVKEVNATPKITCQNNSCQVEILPEKEGFSFNYDQAINNWDRGLGHLDNNLIKLEVVTAQPIITKSEVTKALVDLNLLLATSTTPEFFYQDKKYSLDKKTLATMLIFTKVNNQVVVGLNQELFFQWFKKVIAMNLDVAAQNATLQIKEGKITNLSTHKSGRLTDKLKAYNDLNDKLTATDFNNLKFELTVTEVAPEVVTESVNDLGVSEIIGTGESNFAGSPTNRIKNIKNGASKLHGILIKPGEEFSLIQTLLPVDASNGYVTELVIKGNKTTPEYGGGLCQVGTTLFRATLASGMPIIERQNHSYSVTYYLENGLPGVDATIYDPKPDFRFKNDTANYILIQSRIEGTKIYFDFWGTKDGRVASRTKPKTWGLNKPAPTKIIETTNLKPGEKKCTESSHNGISASFNYIVAYGDGRTVTSTFTSVYKPWQAVCLVGVSAISSSSPAISTSTIDN